MDERQYEEEQLRAVAEPTLEPITGSWLEAWLEDREHDGELTAEEIAEMDEDELVARGIEIP
jgi:hypothetical protein